MADDAQIIAIEHRFWYKKKITCHIFTYTTTMKDENNLEWKFADMKYKAFKIHLILMEQSVHDR